MDWQAWRERLTRWFAPDDPNEPKRPAPTASDDVIHEYFERAGKQVTSEMHQLGIDDQLRAIEVQQAMLWEAVPPEERQALRLRIRETHRDHYRMTPEEFAAEYREYLDKDGTKSHG